jgi:hypothetical protein
VPHWQDHDIFCKAQYVYHREFVMTHI